jgi:alpha-amylase/alpha-mannosidase (GH57 family)
MTDRFFFIHGHFYQPPREEPFTGKIPREAGAEPYHDFNEKITAECYQPNAAVGNFERISFDLGPTLAAWMSAHAANTYQRIVQSDQANVERFGVGNAVAQSAHHSILPLARRRDKITQVAWGIASFEYRFGRKPEGMWLPEMAVDYETLEALAGAGLSFTILSDDQVQGDTGGRAGPYRIRLSAGRSITVFVRDRFLSNQISFDMEHFPGARAWAAQALGSREPGLTLVATDGETFGHHHRGGVRFLQDLVGRDVLATGFQVTTLSKYLADHPPQVEIEIREMTSWSCGHGVARWVTGCDCTPGDGRWKGALRRALDNLSGEMDLVYTTEVGDFSLKPWTLRDAYIAVVLGQMDGPTFLAAQGLGDLPTPTADRILKLLRAEFHRQRMYASCAFFFEELTRFEPRYAIANAARAVQLVKEATGEDLSHGFRRDLSAACSPRAGVTGADLYDAILAAAQVNELVK